MKHIALSLTVSALVATLGCGDKTSDKAAGGNEASKKFVGKWELDTDAMKEAMKAQAGDNPLAGLAEGMLSSMKIEVDFKSDGTATFSMNALGHTEEESGKWTASGDALTIEATNEKGEKETMKGTLVGADKLKLSKEGEADELHLKRAG